MNETSKKKLLHSHLIPLSLNVIGSCQIQKIICDLSQYLTKKKCDKNVLISLIIKLNKTETQFLLIRSNKS